MGEVEVSLERNPRAAHGAVAENSYLAGDAVEGGPLGQLLGHSMTCMDALMSRAHGCAGATTYRIAVGPHAGRKVFTLQTLPDCNEPFVDPVGKVAGFSARTRVPRRGWTNARNGNVCAVTSQDQRYRKIGCRC